MEQWEKFNFLQHDIDKFERRRKKVIEQPDPDRMQVNALLYELWRDYRQSQLDAWKRGEPFIYCNTPMYRAVVAMDLHPLELAYFTNTMNRDIVMRYFNAARDIDFPAESCDWTQLSTGVALLQEIPKPSAVFWSNAACGPVSQQSAWMAAYFKVPGFGIDVAPDSSERGLRFVVAQLEDMIAQLERLFPGHKYDEAKHQRILDEQLEIQDVVDEILELRSAVPTPVGARDAMRMAPSEMVDDRLPEYYRRLRDEVKARIQKGARVTDAKTEERARLLWLALVPSITDPYGGLERNGIVSPLSEISAGVVRGYRLGPEMEAKFGRKLRPLEQEAAKVVYADWGGPAARRWDTIEYWCKKYKIDGLVHPNMPGCATCVGSIRVIAERAREELGIPTLMVDGWIQDFEKLDETSFKSQLEQFGEMVARSKAKTA